MLGWRMPTRRRGLTSRRCVRERPPAGGGRDEAHGGELVASREPRLPGTPGGPASERQRTSVRPTGRLPLAWGPRRLDVSERQLANERPTRDLRPTAAAREDQRAHEARERREARA